MIRFCCPVCHHTIKAPEETAGRAVICPRCEERAVVPAGDPATRAAAAPWGREARPSREVRPLQALVALVVAVGALSLLVALLAPALHFSEDSAAQARGLAMGVVPTCLVLLLVLLHGRGTSCPSCGRPWARAEGETECLGREEYRKGGESWVRARRRTNYRCKRCGHQWSATYTDEYKGTLRHRPGAA